MIILSIAVLIVICFSLYAYISINEQDINVTEAMQQTKQTANKASNKAHKTIIEQKTLEQRYYQLAKNQLAVLDQYKQLGMEQTEAFKKSQEKLNYYLRMSKLNIDKV